jgi:hypothetical protein
MSKAKRTDKLTAREKRIAVIAYDQGYYDKKNRDHPTWRLDLYHMCSIGENDVGKYAMDAKESKHD